MLVTAITVGASAGAGNTVTDTALNDDSSSLPDKVNSLGSDSLVTPSSNASEDSSHQPHRSFNPEYFNEDLQIDIVDVSNYAVAPGGEIEVTIEHQSESYNSHIQVRDAIEYAQDRLGFDRLLTGGYSVDYISSGPTNHPEEDTHTITYEQLSTDEDGDPHGDDEIELYAQTTDALENNHDLEGESDSVTISLVDTPEAVFDTPDFQPQPGQTFVLEASNSNPSESDAFITEYAWDLNNDGSFNEVSSSGTLGHSFDEPGYYWVTLQITDSNGLTDTTSERIRVNDPPTADFEYTPSDPVAEPDEFDTTVSFDASESEDPDFDGEIIEYKWQFEGPNYYERTGEYTSVDLMAGTWDVTLTVTDEDYGSDSIQQTVEIDELDESNFNVDISDTTEPIKEGDQLGISVAVENTGDMADTKDVSIRIPGLGSDSESVYVEGGDSTSVDLAVDTNVGDAGSYTATTESPDNTDSTTVTIDAQPDDTEFEVSMGATNSPVEEGDRLTINADVTNVGDLSGTETIELEIPGLGSDSQSVTLDGGEELSVGFDIYTAAGDAGSYTATAESPDDSASMSVSVEEQPDSADFEVSIADSTGPVEAGKSLEIPVSVTNTGDLSATKSVELGILGLGSDSESVQLGGGDSTEITLSVDTTSDDAGEYTATVDTPDGDDSTSVVITEQPNDAEFIITSFDTDSPVEAGETLDATVGVENIGDVESSSAVILNLPGVGSTSESLSLDAGASDTIELAVETAVGDAGSYNATVEADNDTDGTSVNVNPQTGNISITSTPDGADIYLDRDWVGTTPWSDDRPVTESYELKIDADGYDPVTRSGISAPANEQFDLGSATAGAAVSLEHSSTVQPDETVTVTVETDNATETVLEFTTEELDLEVSSDEATVIDGSRLEFNTSTPDNSAYTVEVDVIGGTDGDTIELVSWVNAADRGAADADTTSTLTVEKASDGAGKAAISISPDQESITPGEQITHEIEVSGLKSGLGTADFTIDGPETEHASIITAESTGSDLGETTIGDDGTWVRFEQAVLGSAPESDYLLGAIETNTTKNVPSELAFEFTNATIEDDNGREYDVATNGATVEVDDIHPPDDPLTYADNDGVIRINGLLNAVTDYSNGEIDIGLVLDVVSAYNSGDPVG